MRWKDINLAIGSFLNKTTPALMFFSATALGQLIPLIGSLLVVRLYTPVDYGLYAAWFGVVSILSVVLTGRFDIALSLVDDNERMRSVVLTLATGLLIFIVVIITFLPFISYITFPVFGLNLNLLFTAFPCSLLLAAVQILQSWAVSDGRFKTLAVSRIVQAGSITALQVLGGVLWANPYSLILFHTIGVATGLIYIYQSSPDCYIHITWRSLLEFWQRYRKFPLFALPADTLNAAVVQLPSLIVASRFGPETAGYLALALRTLNAPMSIFGSVFLDFFKRKGSASWRSIGACQTVFLETFVFLAGGSFMFVVAFWFFGGDLMFLAFGKQWEQATTIAYILLPLIAFRFVASPLSFTLYLSEKQHIDLLWQVGLLMMTLFSLFLFSQFEASIKAYVFGYSLFYLIYLLLCYRASTGRGI